MQAGHLQKGVPASLPLLSDPLAHCTKPLVFVRLLQQLSQFTKYRKLSPTTKSCIVFSILMHQWSSGLGRGAPGWGKTTEKQLPPCCTPESCWGRLRVKLLQASRRKSSSVKTWDCVNTNSCEASIPWIYVFTAPASSKPAVLILLISQHTETASANQKSLSQPFLAVRTMTSKTSSLRSCFLCCSPCNTAILAEPLPPWPAPKAW